MSNIDYVAEHEGWNVYLLDNGVKLKVRVTVSKITERSGQFLPNGYPIYDVGMQQNLEVILPPEMLAEAEARAKHMQEED